MHQWNVIVAVKHLPPQYPSRLPVTVRAANEDDAIHAALGYALAENQHVLGLEAISITRWEVKQ